MSTLEHRKRLQLGRHSNGRLLSPEEFDSAQFDERYSYELVHGVLVVSPFAGLSERGPNELLGNLLFLYQTQHPQGRILDLTAYEQEVAIGPDRRRADRALWIGLGRTPDVEVDLPTILVEFVSRSRRDRVRDYEEKTREYLAIGVREYWIIDPFARTLTAHRADPVRPTTVVVPAEGTYTTPLLPGFELPLAPLLQVADALKKPTRPRPAR